jgi:Protein of unknown function (DUF4240)
MTEQEFWKIIELSWKDSPNADKKRADALETNDEELLEELSEFLTGEILEKYKKRLLLLDKKEFTEFIHILEERLFNLDREEIHEFTDGSDDGFLYCRCFILGMGERYYKMVDNEPAKATADVEAEDFGFSAYKVYEEKFGEEFDRYSVHCVESGSNQTGWKP